MMLKIYCNSLAACFLLVAVVAFAAPASAQTVTGSFEELLDVDLAPLETSPAPLPGLPYLGDPGELQVAPPSVSNFSIGPLEEVPLQSTAALTEQRSVLDAPVEVPHVALDPVDSSPIYSGPVDSSVVYSGPVDSGVVYSGPVDSLVLPDLSVPTPENTRADLAPVLSPRLHAPQPLTYSQAPLAVPRSSFDRYRGQSMPLQIQFYSVRQVTPAFSSGVRPNPYAYRSSGYLPYGGYQSFSGYGGNRGPVGARPPRGPGCSGRR